MVRGNEYLEFEDHEIQWQDDPRPRRPRAAHRAGRQHDSALGGLFVLAVLVVSILVALGSLADRRPAPAPEQSAEPQVQAPGVAAAQESKPPGPVSPQPRYALDLQVDGRVYRVKSFTGREIRGDIPPGFRFGSAVTDLHFFDAPRGRFLGVIPEGTRFLYGAFNHREPCWRWMITLDGNHQGFICPTFFGRRPQTPPAPTAAGRPPEQFTPSPWSGVPTFRYEHENRTHEAPLYPPALEDERIPVAPHGSGCASVRGIIQTFTIGNEPARKYELPLCGQ